MPAWLECHVQVMDYLWRTSVVVVPDNKTKARIARRNTLGPDPCLLSGDRSRYQQRINHQYHINATTRTHGTNYPESTFIS